MGSKDIFTLELYDIFYKEYHNYLGQCKRKKLNPGTKAFIKFMKIFHSDFRQFTEKQLENKIIATRNREGERKWPSISNFENYIAPRTLNLLDNSVAAMLSAVELHNKPVFSYRYETTVVLVINAWELLLKAFIIEFVPSKNIFFEDGKTKEFDKCLDYVQEHLKKDFLTVKANLEQLFEFRCKIIHFYDDNLDSIIFGLLKKNIEFYIGFLKHYFRIDVCEKSDMIILPIGFKKPVSPLDFISNVSASKESSKEVKEFIRSLTDKYEELEKEGIDESFMINYSMTVQNESNVKRADLVAAITKEPTENTVMPVISLSDINITDNPNAKKVNLDDSEIFKLFPYTYEKIWKKAQEKIPGFRKNNVFNKLMESIKSNKNLSYERVLNPSNKKVTMLIYNEKAFKEIDNYYKSIK